MNIMIETGKHQKVPKTERFCPFCYDTVEDEIHFLINCKWNGGRQGKISHIILIKKNLYL